MRRAISFLLALVFCFSLAISVSAAVKSPAQSGRPSVVGGSNWYKGSKNGMSVSVKGGEVESVKVAGKTLDKDDYKVTEKADGTTTITLDEEYLNSLPAGSYTMTIMVNGKAVTHKFTVTDAGVYYDGNPKTGDSARMELWVPTMIASALALVAVVFAYFKKFRKVN